MNHLSHDRKRNCSVVVALAVLLGGCAAPSRQVETYGFLEGTIKRSNDLSTTREKQLGDAFIGRDFVFRALWHEYADVDPDPDLGQPCPLKVVTKRAAGMAIRVPAGSAERDQLIVAARPGDVATIKGVVFARDLLTLHSRKQNGQPVYLTVLMPRGRTLIGTKTTDCGSRQKINDENLTVAWLEDVLTGTVLEFVAPALPRAKVDLPEPERGLVLQPPASADAVRRHEPAVALLAADAEPKTVRRGEVVRLTMTFSVDAGAARPVQVGESYLLTFNGKPLPKFPVQRAETREAGEHRGVYTQRIPTAATPGTYGFKAEVCVEGVCNSRVTEFEITQ